MTERQPTKKFSPEVRRRAVRTLVEHRGEHALEWSPPGTPQILILIVGNTHSHPDCRAAQPHFWTTQDHQRF